MIEIFGASLVCAVNLNFCDDENDKAKYSLYHHWALKHHVRYGGADERN